MSSYIVYVEHKRTMDGHIKTRKILVDASNQQEAEQQALQYCDGYFQYERLAIIKQVMKFSNSAVSLDSL